MNTSPISDKRHRFPPQIIANAAEESCFGCRGNLLGGQATDDALYSDKERGAAERVHAGQQDGAWHLSHDDETRGLPESGDGAGMIFQQST